LTLTNRSRNGSCSTPPILENDMDDTYPCQLFWDGTRKTLVACGKAFEAATILHGMSYQRMRLRSEVVLVSFALVPVPTNEVYIVAQAFQRFLAWPRDLVDSDPPGTDFQTHHVLNF